MRMSSSLTSHPRYTSLETLPSVRWRVPSVLGRYEGLTS